MIEIDLKFIDTSRTPRRDVTARCRHKRQSYKKSLNWPQVFHIIFIQINISHLVFNIFYKLTKSLNASSDMHKVWALMRASDALDMCCILQYRTFVLCDVSLWKYDSGRNSICSQYLIYYHVFYWFVDLQWAESVLEVFFWSNERRYSSLPIGLNGIPELTHVQSDTTTNYLHAIVWLSVL